MNKNSFTRVNRRQCCPVCEKPDWCLIALDGTAAICSRIQSATPVGEKGAGWLHRLDVGQTSNLQAVVKPQDKTPTTKADVEWSKLQHEFRRTLKPLYLSQLARQLGVSATSLQSIGIGWHSKLGVFTFPMFDAWGNVIGLRTRNRYGRKRALPGSSNGLFMRIGLLDDEAEKSDCVLIAEGPTDTAALIDAGTRVVVGLPGCRSGWEFVIPVLAKLNAQRVMLLCDNDEAGLSAFADLATKLSTTMPKECIGAIVPPKGIKDAREWTQKNRKHLVRTLAVKIEQLKNGVAIQ